MNPLTKFLKSFMTQTPPTDPFSDERPEMDFAKSMDSTTSEGKPAQPNEEVYHVDADTKAVVELFGSLTPPQRLAFTQSAIRQWCLGCGNELPKSGGVCRSCNGD